MSTSYRITWEGVMPMGKGASYYHGERPICRPEDVPDEAWTAGENITDDPWDQYNGLKGWAESGEELIRNVRLFKREDPDWEPVVEPAVSGGEDRGK